MREVVVNEVPHVVITKKEYEKLLEVNNYNELRKARARKYQCIKYAEYKEKQSENKKNYDLSDEELKFILDNTN